MVESSGENNDSAEQENTRMEAADGAVELPKERPAHGHDTTRIAPLVSDTTTGAARPSDQSTGSIEATDRRFSPSEDTLSAIQELGLRLQVVADQKIIGRVAHYDIIRILGRGGMGAVFEAFDTRLFRPVAIKFMASSLAANEKSRSRFLREARVAASINHNNVVTIHAVDEYEGRPYLVMELVAGTSLHEYIKRHGPLPVGDALRIGRQIATGLRAAHEKAIVHRDVKPGNILLENGIQRVKIVDFGLAQVIFERSEITSQGQTLGTPRYMAPEQIEDHRVDERADLFSFGCVLYAMCAGQPPFVGNSISVLQRILRDQHVSLRQANAEVPQALSSLVDSMLCKDRTRRVQTAADVESALAEIIRNEGSASAEVRHAVIRQDGSLSSRLLRWLIPAGVFALAVIAFAVFSRDRGNNGGSADPDIGANQSPALALDPTDVPHDGVFLMPPRPHGPDVETIRVGAQGDFASVKAAIRYVQPGDSIIVTGPVMPDDVIRLDDPVRHANLTIKWQETAVMEVPTGVTAAIEINSVPGTHISGLSCHVADGHLLSVTGDCSGLVVEDCRLEQASGCHQAAVVFWPSACGSVADAITIRDCQIVFHELGCVFIGSAQQPVQHVEIRNNRIRGLQREWGTGIVLENLVRGLNIVGNRMSHVRNAISAVGQFDSVQVQNNTFFEVTECIGAGLASNGEAVEVNRNLAIDCKLLWPASGTAHPTFTDNVSNTNMSELAEVSIVEPLTFVSKEWADDDFLTPYKHEQLPSVSTADGLSFAGAIRPVPLTAQ